jgi:hypothetical protein
MEDRIYFGGKWYVAETPEQPVAKTVDWMISKLKEISDAGGGNYEVTVDVDYGNDYDTVDAVFVMDFGRVHIR